MSEEIFEIFIEMLEEAFMIKDKTEDEGQKMGRKRKKIKKKMKIKEILFEESYLSQETVIWKVTEQGKTLCKYNKIQK